MGLCLVDKIRHKTTQKCRINRAEVVVLYKKREIRINKTELTYCDSNWLPHKHIFWTFMSNYLSQEPNKCIYKKCSEKEFKRAGKSRISERIVWSWNYPSSRLSNSRVALSVSISQMTSPTLICKNEKRQDWEFYDKIQINSMGNIVTKYAKK